MSNQYQIACDCESVKIVLTGEPIVRGICHCEDCRELLNVPYHSVTAWEKEQAVIESGTEDLAEFKHPSKRMSRFFCRICGESMFNSNAKDWRVVSQLLIRKNYDGALPEALRPKLHFYYGSRIVDIDDELPKRD